MRGQRHAPAAFYPPGKDPVPIVQEAGWALGPVWTGAENLAPTGIRSPDRPARSQSLYRLSYPAHVNKIGLLQMIFLLLTSPSPSFILLLARFVLDMSPKPFPTQFLDTALYFILHHSE